MCTLAVGLRLLYRGRFHRSRQRGRELAKFVPLLALRRRESMVTKDSLPFRAYQPSIVSAARSMPGLANYAHTVRRERLRVGRLPRAYERLRMLHVCRGLPAARKWHEGNSANAARAHGAEDEDAEQGSKRLAACEQGERPTPSMSFLHLRVGS